MAKLTLNDISGGYASTTELNANFDDIETAFDNTLSRDGTSPNQMGADIDMNTYNINNVGNVSANNVIRQGQSLVPSSVVAIDTASSVPNVPAGDIAATDVQAAINELDAEKIPLIASPDTGDMVTQAADGTLSKAGWAFTNVNADITASDEEINHSVGVTSNIQTQLDAKVDIGFRGALVYLTAAQTLTTGTQNEILFTSEEYDTDSIHDVSTDTGRLTVPTGVTKVRVLAQVGFDANASGLRSMDVRLNAATTWAGRIRDFEFSPDGTTGTILHAASPVISVTGGDYFQIYARQTSGGDLDLISGNSYTWFALEIIQ